MCHRFETYLPNLAPVSSSASSVYTVFCLVYFFCLRQITFFTDLKIVGESGTWTPGYLWWNLILYDLLAFVFHIIHIEKSTAQVCISPSVFITVRTSHEKLHRWHIHVNKQKWGTRNGRHLFGRPFDTSLVATTTFPWRSRKVDCAVWQRLCTVLLA
jgi:hypothetical protein